MWPWLLAAGLAAGAGKGLQWYLGREALKKPTPFRPDYSGGDYAKLRADWEKGLQSQMQQARGAGTQGITEAMASRGILSSGITAGALGEMETGLGEKAIQERSAFNTQLYGKYMEHKQSWEAAERARLLAKDQLTMDLLNDIISGLGIVGMQKFQTGEWDKLLKAHPNANINLNSTSPYQYLAPSWNPGKSFWGGTGVI